MSKWKPKYGETFWYVNEVAEVAGTTWEDDIIDREFYKSGNCFYTVEEAEAAAEKVKALLLSLHETVTDCNQSEQPTTNSSQLPKLTAEVFDRPDCPEWAKYAAVTPHGSLLFFAEKPIIVKNKNNFENWNTDKNWYYAGMGCFDTTDWQNSLIKRHVKENELPDWCKPGAWVWSNNFGFFLITSIKDGAIKGECPGYGEIFVDYHSEKIKEAYIRPFTHEEMKNLVGKILVNKETKDINLVTDYINEVDEDDPSYHYCTVYVGGENMVATDLLEDFTIDGYPCGQLERKEDCDDNF
jgi:hypothetical protein